MKRLLLILILTLSFHSLSKADDIRDFEIEGMSVGDSLLDYFTKDVIENSKILNPNKNIKIARAELKGDYKTYEEVQFWWFIDDKNYEIVGIAGELNFEKKIDKCKKKQKEISSAIKNTFNNLSFSQKQTTNQHDKTKKSITYHHALKLPDGNLINIQCYKYSEYIKDEFPGTKDHLKVIVVTKIMDDHYFDARKN
jgi:hypothetical protein